MDQGRGWSIGFDWRRTRPRTHSALCCVEGVTLLELGGLCVCVCRDETWSIHTLAHIVCVAARFCVRLSVRFAASSVTAFDCRHESTPTTAFQIIPRSVQGFRVGLTLHLAFGMERKAGSPVGRVVSLATRADPSCRYGLLIIGNGLFFSVFFPSTSSIIAWMDSAHFSSDAFQVLRPHPFLMPSKLLTYGKPHL